MARTALADSYAERVHATRATTYIGVAFLVPVDSSVGSAPDEVYA